MTEDDTFQKLRRKVDGSDVFDAIQKSLDGLHGKDEYHRCFVTGLYDLGWDVLSYFEELKFNQHEIDLEMFMLCLRLEKTLYGN